MVSPNPPELGMVSPGTQQVGRLINAGSSSAQPRLKRALGLRHDPKAVGDQAQAITLQNGVRSEDRVLTREILRLRRKRKSGARSRPGWRHFLALGVDRRTRPSVVVFSPGRFSSVASSTPRRRPRGSARSRSGRGAGRGIRRFSRTRRTAQRSVHGGPPGRDGTKKISRERGFQGWCSSLGRIRPVGNSTDDRGRRIAEAEREGHGDAGLSMRGKPQRSPWFSASGTGGNHRSRWPGRVVINSRSRQC